VKLLSQSKKSARPAGSVLDPQRRIWRRILRCRGEATKARLRTERSLLKDSVSADVFLDGERQVALIGPEEQASRLRHILKNSLSGSTTLSGATRASQEFLVKQSPEIAEHGGASARGVPNLQFLEREANVEIALE
jgi:hypothetical protein